ncbi:MAG: hypothetical protein U5L06_11720 [Rhodovibrio sp.]|nr:hypothetical protein [Rhodovibrio sp.]
MFAATAVMTLLVLIFSEVLPKTYAHPPRRPDGGVRRRRSCASSW